MVQLKVGAAEFLAEAGWLVGFHRRTADVFHQQPGGCQRLITHHLGGETDARRMRQQTVLRVAAERCGREA